MSTYAVVLSMVGSVMAFAPVSPYSSRVASASALKVVTDPNTVSKKQYEDICGVSFGEDEMVSRLQQTNYLYPKHVEVIEDLAPIADEMTNKIVSTVSIYESMHACVSLHCFTCFTTNPMVATTLCWIACVFFLFALD